MRIPGCVSRRPTVPSAVPFAFAPPLRRLTGTSDNYLPVVAGLPGCLGLVLATGRHHLTPVSSAVLLRWDVSGPTRRTGLYPGLWGPLWRGSHCYRGPVWAAQANPGPTKRQHETRNAPPGSRAGAPLRETPAGSAIFAGAPYRRGTGWHAAAYGGPLEARIHWPVAILATEQTVVIAGPRATALLSGPRYTHPTASASDHRGANPVRDIASDRKEGDPIVTTATAQRRRLPPCWQLRSEIDLISLRGFVDLPCWSHDPDLWIAAAPTGVGACQPVVC
jgi:hypothetical protein